MSNASIVIIGRPNVGKSTLINRILKKRKSITNDQPGVTRDILEYAATWKKYHFRLIDTGGVFFEKSNDIPFQTDIEAMVAGVLENASHIVLLSDGKSGLHPIDANIARQLRPYRSKVTIAVNKIDDPSKTAVAGEFYQLGFGTPIPISATQGSGIDILMSECVKDFQAGTDVDEPSVKLAIVGRPNVGKSSLINAFLNKERVIVSERAGTTRDSVEILFSYKKQTFLLVDTAGMRKASKVSDSIEFYSGVRSQKALYAADICLVVLDATDLLRDQDKRIIDMALTAHRRLIIFVNKWDIAKEDIDTKEFIRKRIIMEMPSLENYPIIIGSAFEKDQITKLLDLVPQIVADGQTRIPTPELNQFIADSIRRNPPPSRSSRPVRVYYATQVGTTPPEFVLFVNQPRLVLGDYERYLENRLRQRFPCFLGNPIIIKYKGDKAEDAKAQ